MSVSENIYKENLFASVRGTCTRVLHLPPAQISQRDLVSDMLPASLRRLAASKTASPTLTANLIHPAPLISAFLSTSCPASNLVQTEVDNNGIATVSICVRFDKAGNFSNRADFEEGNLAILCLGKAC